MHVVDEAGEEAAGVAVLLGVGLDVAERLWGAQLDSRIPASVPRVFDSLTHVLTGHVAATTLVSLNSVEAGSAEGEQLLYRAIQSACFEAYLGSDDYSRVLEDAVTAVHKQWQTRIDNNRKRLSSELRGGSLEINR